MNRLLALKITSPNKLIKKTGKLLSKSTVHAVLVILRKFFEWLYGQLGFKSKFSY